MNLSIYLVFICAVGHKGLHVSGLLVPVVAQLGGSVLLPCFIESPLPPEGFQVEWRKIDLNSVVNLFQQGKNRSDLQSQEFKGRVDFFPDEILKGNLSILLRNVVKEDAGVYSCKVNTTQTQNSSEVIIEIKNSNNLVVSGADRAVIAREGEDVILNCSVDASHFPVSEIEEVTWKRTDGDQDILVLLYQDSEIFPDSSHEKYRGRVDLFTSEIPKGNFSLKLKTVEMEDQGEFMCEVYTKHTSARAIVILQGVGFSAVHMAILVWCFIAMLITVGFCGPVFILLRKRVTSKKGMKRNLSLILCPNICMFISFCLWSKEGFLSEVIACSVVSIMRPVILMKASTYLDMLPQHLQKALKSLAVPLYHSTIAMATCSIFFENLALTQITSGHIIKVLAVVMVIIVLSAVLLAVYGLQMYLTVCLEIFNIAVLGILLSNSSNIDYSFEIPSVTTPQTIGMMMVLSLKRHLFQGKPFSCVHLVLPSVIVAILSLSHICVYILLSVTINDFARGWILLFDVVIFILAWSGVIYILRCPSGQREGCCSQWKKNGDLCCTLTVAFLITTLSAVSLHYLNIITEDKDRSGSLALIAFIHVLTAICLFKHPRHLPEFLHMMVYMFGAVVLSTVNAIALVTELILKAEKGERTIGDLRLIVLPLEMVFLFGWLFLQLYDSWMRFTARTNQNSENGRTGHEVVQEMELRQTLPLTD